MYHRRHSSKIPPPPSIILANLLSFDIPFVTRLSLELGQFRTFGIPTISKLLHSTREYEDNCGKRYDDTDLILREILENGSQSDRARQAIFRLNDLHGRYKISNDDFLYTLGVFVICPVRFIDQYGYRTLTTHERDALMKEFGEHMGRDGMKIEGVPKSWEGMEAWFEEYEARAMVYSKSNEKVADATMDLFCSIWPKWSRRVVRQAAYCAMDDRLKTACGLKDEEGFDWQCFRCLIRIVLFLWPIVERYFTIPSMYDQRRTPTGKACPVMRPNWHPFEKTYEDGYQIGKLGPPGKHGAKKDK